jgi:4-amino-4-deoxy-L-arabinose transferase-like glycosyltransferase
VPALPRAAWIILAVAFVVRVGAVAAHRDYVPYGDPADYERMARVISDLRYPGRTEGLPGPTAGRPPAYPVALGAVYAVDESRTLARLVQAVVGTITVGLVGLVALLALRRRRVALTAMALAAVWPPFWLIGGALLSEVLFVPLTLGAVAAALRFRDRPRLRWAVLAGVLIGLAGLTRANGLVLALPVAVAIGTAAQGAALRPVVALLAAAILTLAPWTIRNAVEFGALVPVATEDGFTLAGTYNDVAREQERFPAAWVNWYQVPSNLDAIDSVENDERVWNDKLRGESLAYAADHPGYVPKVAWWNLRRLFDAAGQDWLEVEFASYGLPRWMARLELLAFWPVLLLALAGLALGGARALPRWLWLVPALLLLPILTTGYMRFRAPIDPYLVVLAAIAVVALWERRTASGRGAGRRARSSAGG